MGWFETILLGLKLLTGLLDWVRARQQFTAGQDAEIAKTTLALLEKTEAGKRITEKLNAMPDGELDAIIDDLGRRG